MDNDSAMAALHHHLEQMQQQDDCLRFEIAKVAAEVAARGRHPESAAPLERILLTAAELPLIPQRNELQTDLFNHP